MKIKITKIQKQTIIEYLATPKGEAARVQLNDAEVRMLISVLEKTLRAEKYKFELEM